ncbi:MAG: tRNA dihydrouridine synthase DusB [Oscillospiraceae bacterium]|jgi:tRNA-dihydrouridine synthase B|nr:tRNA dihydrouridine synthase DusB [Oscillospiraceae bacterium]
MNNFSEAQKSAAVERPAISALCLAPMAGVTDVAFREVCVSFGAVQTCSEMVSARALVYQDKKSLTLLPRGKGETNYAVQLFGHEPELLAAAAEKVIALEKPDWLDLNMGCPTGKIIRNGDGAALMQNPRLVGEIVAAVRSAVGGSAKLSVKIRKGFDNGNINAVEIAQIAEANGAQRITVHGRTAKQLYSGLSDSSIIREVKKAVSVPVVANGDVFSPRDAEKLLQYTGADYAMVGRGAMGNPWIFAGLEAPGLYERVTVALAQISRAAELKGEYVACLEARKHFAWYLRGLRGATRLRDKISRVTTLGELRGIAVELCGNL